MIALLKELNLPYKDESLYEMAFTHSSYAYENQTLKYEKLEFLGDAVIQLLMSDYLYKEDLADEGEMTKKRAQAVCEKAFVIYSKDLKLGSYIKLGKGESLKGPNKSMIADAFEALFAAIYLDLGLEEARRVFYLIAVPNFHLVWKIKDYKSALQELIQSVKQLSCKINNLEKTNQEIEHDAFEKLKMLNIDHLAHKQASRVSGGEKQRIAIARALVTNPKIVLCDEPTAALDSKSLVVVMEELRQLADQGKSVVVVTHDPRLKPYAHRIVEVNNGMVQEVKDFTGH